MQATPDSSRLQIHYRASKPFRSQSPDVHLRHCKQRKKIRKLILMMGKRRKKEIEGQRNGQGLSFSPPHSTRTTISAPAVTRRRRKLAKADNVFYIISSRSRLSEVKDNRECFACSSDCCENISFARIDLRMRNV